MKKISIISIIFFLSMSVFAQEYVTALTYTISAPTNDTQMFVENESYLGISFDGKTYLNDWMSVGGYIGWHVMYGQTDEVLDIEKGHVSGNQFRYINSFPLMLNTHIYLGGVDCFRPFFGINAGGYYVWERFEMGLIVLEDKNIRWGIAPEVGFTVPIGDVHLQMAAKYNFALAPSESNIFSEPLDTSYISFHIGFAYNEW